MRLAELVRRVERGMEAGLPGPAAQLRLAPTPRPGWEPGRLEDSARTGAGLVLLFPAPAGDEADAGHVLLTERTSRLPNHAGQISLPGGGVDADETIEEAALREAHEEVGIDAATVRLLGRLTPIYIPVSRFNLFPVVGVVERRPRWVEAPAEVARVLEPTPERLADPAHVRWERRQRPWGELDIPYLAYDGVQVWGATGMILAEFLTLVGLPPDPGPRPV